MKNEKQILKEIDDLDKSAKILKAAVTNNNKELSNINSKKIALRQQIENLKITELTVADHAFVRYLERVEGIDLNAIRSKILSNELKKTFKDLGLRNAKITIDNFVIVINDCNVVTVINKNLPEQDNQ